jgi:hypothetical protein
MGLNPSLTNSRHKSAQSNEFGSGGAELVTEFVGKLLIFQGALSNEFRFPAAGSRIT